jgi:hypothetical protein
LEEEIKDVPVTHIWNFHKTYLSDNHGQKKEFSPKEAQNIQRKSEIHPRHQYL